MTLDDLDFDYERFEEYIPEDDDYVHLPAAEGSCGCGPTIEYIPGIGGGLMHRRVKAPPVADTFPEEWTMEEDDDD